MGSHLLQLVFAITVFLLPACSGSKHLKRGLVTERAMVVSAHPLASAVGTQVMQKGGNAIDAAVAVEFALAVVYPDAGNIGGGGFMVLRQNNGQTDALDYRERAPAAAHRNLYLNKKGEVIKGLSEAGHLAAGVPGTVAGMAEAHQKYGSMPWAELVQPAINLAQKGFPLTRKEAAKLNKFRDRFVKLNTVQPTFVLRKRWRAGDTLRLHDLAKTLTLIRDKGPAGFYQGPTADNIVQEMKRGNGLITHEDLKSYRAVWRKPLRGTYKQYSLVSMPPPSSGGIALLQLLQISADYPVREWGWHNPKTIHLMTEAERRVYADRALHLGDPEFHKVPVQGLLHPGYLRSRMASFSPKKASPSKAVSAGKPAGYESPQTTHYSIVDPAGNAVAATTTLNASFGSKVFVAGSGFLLNNQMDDFSSKPGYPNRYGLVGGEANAIEPGKRMLSSMTPTIVEKDSALFMVLGSMGGSTIITTVYQVFLNVVEHGFSMQGAISAGRMHHQWLPNWIMAERRGIKPFTLPALWLKGHKVVPVKAFGRADAVLVLPDGKLEAGADPRGDDAGAGF